MKKKLVWRYGCDHCSKFFSYASGCTRHIPRCFFNPNREPFDGELYPMPTSSGCVDVDCAAWPQWEFDQEHSDLKDLTGWEPCLSGDPDDWQATYIYLEGKWFEISLEQWKRCAKDGPRGAHGKLTVSGGKVEDVQAEKYADTGLRIDPSKQDDEHIPF